MLRYWWNLIFFIFLLCLFFYCYEISEKIKYLWVSLKWVHCIAASGSPTCSAPLHHLDPVCLSINSKFIALHRCWYCSFCAYLTILKHALESLSCWNDKVHFKSNFSFDVALIIFKCSVIKCKTQSYISDCELAVIQPQTLTF